MKAEEMGLFWELASRGKNAWWRYLAACVLAMAITVAIAAVATLVLAFARVIDTRVVAQLQHPTDAPAFFLGAAAIFGALLLGFLAAIAIVQKKSPRDVTGPWRWDLFLAGLAIWTVVEIAGTALDYVLAPRGFTLSLSHATLALGVFAALGLSIQTFAEEFIFRGYVTQGVLLALKRPIAAAIVSGLIFGALHIPNGPPQALNAVFFGIVCSYLAIRTGGIWLPFGIHLANNFFGAVVVVSTDDVFKGSPGIFTQNAPNLLWSDVGVATVALLAVAFWVARSSQTPGQGAVSGAA